MFFLYRQTVNPFRTAVSRFGGKTLKIQVVCPQNGTAVLTGLIKDGIKTTVLQLLLLLLLLLTEGELDDEGKEQAGTYLPTVVPTYPHT